MGVGGDPQSQKVIPSQREASGLTQERAGEKANLDPTYISGIAADDPRQIKPRLSDPQRCRPRRGPGRDYNRRKQTPLPHRP